jgi:hypothetical protein
MAAIVAAANLRLSVANVGETGREADVCDG